MLAVVAVVSVLAIVAGRSAVGCAFDLSDPTPDQGSPGGSGGHATGSDGGSQSDGPVTVSSGTGGLGGGGGEAGSGGLAPMQTGCSDGHREAYGDDATFTAIAGCAGAFAIPGAQAAAEAGCVAAGDDTGNDDGAGCSANNLCAAGWHVCHDKSEVDAKSGGVGCPSDMPASTFWATGQGENSASNQCEDGGVNNIVGCGNIGESIENGCEPLDHRLRFADCGTRTSAEAPWLCNDNDFESTVVVKLGAAKGGVLCCVD